MPKVHELTYDPETGKLWRNGRVAGHETPRGYWSVWFSGRKERVHRVAWFLYYSEWPTKQIDHINGDRSDNRITNLREATGFQNQQNRGANQNNSSGFKGVSWVKHRQKWRARIDVQGECKHLGTFDTPEEASDAYNKAALRHHGEFAFIDI